MRQQREVRIRQNFIESCSATFGYLKDICTLNCYWRDDMLLLYVIE